MPDWIVPGLWTMGFVVVGVVVACVLTVIVGSVIASLRKLGRGEK